MRKYVRIGGKGAEAARAAGFSQKSAGKYAYQLLEKGHILEAIHREQRCTFTELAAISLGQARMMLEDPKTPAGSRVQLFMTICDRANLAAVRGGDAGDEEAKALREMTLDELHAIAQGFREKRAAEAQPRRPTTSGLASRRRWPLPH